MTRATSRLRACSWPRRCESVRLTVSPAARRWLRPRILATRCLMHTHRLQVEESTVSAKAVAQAVVEHWCEQRATLQPSSADAIALRTGRLMQAQSPRWRGRIGATLRPQDGAVRSLTVLVLHRLDDAALSKKELVLIEALDFKLLERHPYETLETLLQGTRHSVCLCKRRKSYTGSADASLGHHATRCYAIANDTYRYTDLCMLQPPEARLPTTVWPFCAERARCAGPGGCRRMPHARCRRAVVRGAGLGAALAWH